MPRLLRFVEKSDPILRETMPEVTDFNDPELHALIEDMCYSILPEQLAAAKGAHKSAAGMAANQWGIKKRVSLFTPDGSEADSPLAVMINPSYVPFSDPEGTEPETAQAYEGCFSVPLTTGCVSRYQMIVATWYTPAGEKKECILEGWEARVFQHETDHLNGRLFDGQLDNFAGPLCEDRRIFKDNDEMDAFWKNG